VPIEQVAPTLVGDVWEALCMLFTTARANFPSVL
jgi:hypothetical protein